MRLIARYAKQRATDFEIITVWDQKTEIEQVSLQQPSQQPSIKTLSKTHPSALWFERKMRDDFGIIIEDAFDNRPLVQQERFPDKIHPMLKSFQQSELEEAPFKPYKYEAIRGDGVFEVSVGPIHAGIIEPGHFHFSQAGEDILHQEVRHFYKYRGIEKMLEGKSLSQAKAIISRISGNESIAYQLAWRDIQLQASGAELAQGSQKYHAILLEMERIAHHLTDLGFIPNDAGFSAALAFCSKLAEDTRRQLKQLCGHRFGFDAVDFEAHTLDLEGFDSFLDSLEKEMSFFKNWILNIPSLLDRFDTTGILKNFQALKYDVVGVMARASGVATDRRDTPFYQEHGFSIETQDKGDVGARFKLRINEVKQSIALIRKLKVSQVDKVTFAEAKDAKDGDYCAYTESSIGELFMAIELKNGLISRFYVRDPSFINWQALHLMMPGNIIADFPLINKSCDLSYAGNDL